MFHNIASVQCATERTSDTFYALRSEYRNDLNQTRSHYSFEIRLICIYFFPYLPKNYVLASIAAVRITKDFPFSLCLSPCQNLSGIWVAVQFLFCCHCSPLYTDEANQIRSFGAPFSEFFVKMSDACQERKPLRIV